jgi:hypothetical protein
VLNSGVSSTKKKRAKQLLDDVVSSMKNGEEMEDCSVLGVRKIKSVEQWCFINEEEKGETIVGRCCFFDEEW